MGFCFFAVKNVFRSKLRSFFVILMLTLGVLCIITSLSLSGIVLSSLEELSGSDSDLMIYGDNLTMDDLSKIQNTKGVKDAASISTYILGYDNDSLMVKSFSRQKNIHADHIAQGLGHIHILEGSMVGDEGNEIVVTQKFSEKVGKNVGDDILVEGMVPISLKQNPNAIQTKIVNKNFKIVGIIDNVKFDGIIPHKTFNKKENVESIAISTTPGETENVENILKDTYPTIIEPTELPRILNKVFWYITCFIVLVGGFIMMFTTSKSVGERTREIGVLKSIGWNNKRVMSLIFIESLVQLLISWIISIILISVIVFYIANSNQIDLIKYLNDNMHTLTHILGLSILYSLLIPLFGVTFPLWRVARLKPTEALRYE